MKTNTEKYYEYLFDSLHEGVCVVDSEGIVRLWAKKSEKLYGVKRKDIINKPLKDFFPTALLLEVLASRTPVENVIHSPRENTYINISAMPLFSEGKFNGAVSTERDISEVINLSMEMEVAREKLDYLETEVKRINENKYSFGNILGKSRVMEKAVDMAAQVAGTNSSVHIGGESGTGKEVFARAIHLASERSGPFVAINCSAIPDTLFESEMFGYEAGSFTGALSKGKIGKVEFANKGTLFLDEIGDMPLYMQVKLLRVLQEKQVTPLGSEKPVDVDVRVISATNRDLMEMVKQGKFRDDLYYRLNVVNLRLPSLRERQEDIPMFVSHFIEEFCRENHLGIPKINPEVFHILLHYSWPGNVRELKNIVQHLVLFSKNMEITLDSVPKHLLEKKVEKKYSHSEFDLNENLKRIERESIHKAMVAADNNKAKAAKLLNIPRTTLYYKLQQLAEQNVEN